MLLFSSFEPLNAHVLSQHIVTTVVNLAAMVTLCDGGFSGRWHGDVLIHTYDNQTDAEVLEFLRDVANLSRIRHESVCLFMGASLQPPNYAIVTRFRLYCFACFFISYP